MSRCGCDTKCACLVVGGDGIKVDGKGSVASPFVVTLGTITPRVCENIVDTCIGPNLGPGLAYDDSINQIRVKLSADPACRGSIRFGADGGLCVTGEGGGGGEGGGVTVDSMLLAEEYWTVGLRGAGRIMSPENQERSFLRAVAEGLVATQMDINALGDGTLVCCPHRNAYFFMNDASAKDNWRYNSASMVYSSWANIPNRIGSANVDTYTDTGWFRLGEPPQVGGPIVSSILEKIANKIVIVFRLNENRAWPRLLRLINLYGIQESCIVIGNLDSDPQYNTLDSARLAVQAGIKHVGLWLYDRDVTTWSPAAMAAEGFNWMIAGWSVASGQTKSRPIAPDKLKPYRTAGIEVLVDRLNTRVDREAYKAALVRGALSDVPFYHRINTAVFSPDRWSLKRANSGYLSTATEVGAVTQLYYYKAADNGLYIYNRPTSDYWPNNTFTLMGEFCPIVAKSYSISIKMKFETAPKVVTDGMGLIFSCIDDLPDSAGSLVLHQRYNGELALNYSPLDPNAPDVNLGKVDISGTAATLKVGSWYGPYVTTVTPTNLTVTIGTYRINVALSSLSATVRQGIENLMNGAPASIGGGTYFHLWRWTAGNPGAASFAVGFQELTVTQTTATSAVTTTGGTARATSTDGTSGPTDADDNVIDPELPPGVNPDNADTGATGQPVPDDEYPTPWDPEPMTGAGDPNDPNAAVPDA